MKSLTLKLEAIGMRTKSPYSSMTSCRDFNVKCPWVAEITNYDDDKYFKFKRDFLRPLCDYSKSNTVGSRGIFFFFHLFEGKIYEIYYRETWKRRERYYAKVKNGKLVKITKKDVCEWINNI